MMTEDVQEEEQQGQPLVEQVERLTATTESLTRAVERLQRWHPLLGDLSLLLWRGFLYGVAHGLGYAVGATLIVAALIWLLSQLQVVPILGEWIAHLREAIEASQ
jgi:hypothetical protein